MMGRGDPIKDPGGHPMRAKMTFLRLVGNLENNPAKGWIPKAIFQTRFQDLHCIASKLNTGRGAVHTNQRICVPTHEKYAI